MKRPEPRLKLYYRQFEIKFEKYESDSQPMHWHDTEYEIEFVSNGKGVHKMNGKDFPFERGCMYVARLRDYHQIDITEKATIHRLKLPAKCMPERLVYSMIKSKASLLTKMDEDMTAHIENLFCLLESRPKAESIEEIYMQECLINLIVMLFTGEVNKNPGDSYVSKEEKVEKVLAYLQDNFRRKLSVAEVAAAFDMNPTYLNRIFSEKLGMTVYAAIKLYRMTYAVELLVNTEMRTSEICKMCGYSDDANFQRDFKKRYGISPMKFRKAEREHLQKEKEAKISAEQ